VKVGGGLRYVTGPMGSGKTLYGVRSIVPRLIAGQYVVTNVRLLEDAPERIARHYARSKRNRAKVADKVRRYYLFETELAEAMRYRPPGHGESRALFLWDEAHNDLNNRTYRDRDQALLEWATQLRKLGFEGVLLTQSQDNTDAQLRRICNWQVRLQNQKESVRFLGMRSSPWPLFLAWWYLANTPVSSKTKPMKVERYFLTWHRNLYDTLELFHGLSLADELEESQVVRLPEGGLPEARRSGASSTRSVGGPAEASGGHLLQPTDSQHSEPMPLHAETAPLLTTPFPETSDELAPRRVLAES
jgi:hypothetical protein